MMFDPKMRITELSGAAMKALGAATQAVGRPIIRADSADFHFPDDTVLIAISFEGLAARSVRIVRSTDDEDQILNVGAGSMVYVTSGLRLNDIARIYLTGDDEQAVSGAVTLDLSYMTRRFASPPMLVQWPAGKGERQVLELQSDRQDRRKELIAHLNANRIYYSDAIHRSLDSGTIVAMLAEYSWNGRPLIDQVEPQPLTMAGNYLVFRAPVEPADLSGVTEAGKPKNWGELLHDRAIEVGTQSADDRLIPLPTAGVFAEAVLGRSNSAEKLDITRFWNWKDSPIPLTPTEIAPIDTSSRAMSEDLRPGQLGQPVLNIVNPQSLPNPAGLGASLGVLASPNMFRDMSGLAGTQNLVQAGMQETMQAATDAGQLASANLRTEAQKSVAMAQVAAEVVKSVMGGGASGSSASQGVSGAGAMINHGKSMDKASAGNAAAGGGGAAAIGGNSGSSGSSGGGGATNALRGDSSSPAASANQQAAFQHALYGNLGASGVDAARSTIDSAGASAAFDMGSDGGEAQDPNGLYQLVGGGGGPPLPTGLTLNQLVGYFGELLIEHSLRKQGHIVFRDVYKSVAGNGVDLVSLAPNGEVWVIDNKAWKKGIDGAEALTAQQAAKNIENAKDFVKGWGNKLEREAALKAIESRPVRLVVSNAFAHEPARFTKAVFGKGLSVFDLRMQQVFSNHAAWETAYKALTLRRGMRLVGGASGVVTVGGMVVILGASAATGAILIRGDSHMKAMAMSVASELVADAVVEQLSTKLFGLGTGPAGIAVTAMGLKSDNSYQDAAWARDDLLREIIADFDNLPAADQQASREAIKKLLEEPLQIPPPPPPQTGYTAPAGPYTLPSPPPPGSRI